nr:peptidylprolyl isomerase [bacterium]
MKKNLLRVVALVLVTALFLSGCSLIELNETRRQQQVVARVGDMTITLGEFESQYYNYLYSTGYIYYIDETDASQRETVNQLRDTVLQAMIENKIRTEKATELGYMEQKDGDEAKRDEQLQEAIEETKESYRTEWEEKKEEDDSIDVEAEVEKQWNQWLEDNKEAFEEYKASLLEQVILERAMEELDEYLTKDVTVSEDEVTSKHSSLVQSQRTSYEDKLTQFETDMYAFWKDASTVVCFKPLGYRTVKQILVKIDDDTAKEIAQLRKDEKEEEADQKLEEALKAIQEKADEVLAKVEAGEDFDKLMEDYNEDPGMQSEPQKTHGYLVSEETNFVDSFKEAALGLKTIGDTTGLVKSDYGYHIIKYTGDISSGTVPIDDVRKELEDMVLSEKKTQKISDEMDGWKAGYKIKTYAGLYHIKKKTA